MHRDLDEGVVVARHAKMFGIIYLRILLPISGYLALFIELSCPNPVLVLLQLLRIY